MHSSDLFENLSTATGCFYLSDLRREPYRTTAIEMMTTMDLTGYPLEILADAAEYLFDEKPEFQSMDDAKQYFEPQKKRRNQRK